MEAGQTKYRKSRWLPLHSSVVQARGAYRPSRAGITQPIPVRRSSSLREGTALLKRTVENVFLRMQPGLGW